MSRLVVADLRAGVAGQEIVRGVSLTIAAGEVHAVMGPNGSGKSTFSHALMGRPGVEVLGGSVTLDGIELLDLPPWRRAHAGLFLALQVPTAVPGVSLYDLLAESFAAQGRDPVAVPALLEAEAADVGLAAPMLHRPVNDDFSGGEAKRAELVQLALLAPKVAVLDEVDSGLDVDGLRLVGQRVARAAREQGMAVLAITHYTKLLHDLKPDAVHVLSKGRLVASGGPELAAELEAHGYAGFTGETGAPELAPA
ncbi:MAG: Fe-S cluster assembly ATPase SufC [Acidimicrobiales bacterium]